MGRSDSLEKGCIGGVAESNAAARKSVERLPRREAEDANAYALAMTFKGIARVSSR